MKDSHQTFAHDFAAGLTKDYPEVCFFIYGSFARGDYDIERGSDIDGGLIFDGSGLLSKDSMLGVSNLLARCMPAPAIKLQINVLDRRINCDGRFMSYTQDFTDYFKTEAKVLAGPPCFVNEMNGRNYRSGVLESAAFNLRTVRNTILHSIYLRDSNPSEFDRQTRHVIDLTLKLPKKLTWLQSSGPIITDIDESLRSLERLLPVYDSSALRKLKAIRADPVTRAKEFMERKSELLWESADAFQRMIHAYISLFSKSNDKELRDGLAP